MQDFIIGVIPARWSSSRFPGKPLHEIAGKPLIQHVWEQCQKCSHLDKVIIATDDTRIVKVAQSFGATSEITSTEHISGTDRIAEVARKFPEVSHFINIQGDEPLISPTLIDSLATHCRQHPEHPMLTATHLCEDHGYNDPNIVKLVMDTRHRALFFSRSPLPYYRNPTSSKAYYRHIGIYAYTREFLLKFVKWSPSPLEQRESLEQLRALENGASIHVIITKESIAHGVDTPEQANAIEKKIKEGIKKV